MTFFIAAALASPAELPGALLLPTAAPIGAGHGLAGIGGLVTLQDRANGGTHLYGTLRATVGITDRFAIDGALRAPTTDLALGLRYNVVQLPSFRLAPWVLGVASADLLSLDQPFPYGVGATAGLALEGGGSQVRYDLSLPLLMSDTNPFDSPLYAPILLGSTGITVAVGREDAVRVGVESLISPAIVWRHVERRWYLQFAGLYSVLERELLVAGEVGLRF